MPITMKTIQEARFRIQPYIRQTPVIRADGLDGFLNCEVYLKAECMQATGSLKLRGAMNKLLSLPASALSRSIVAASSCNR